MPECVLCREAVTNPVCPDCLAEQIAAWLGEREPGLIAELRLKTRQMSMHLFDEDKCVICFKGMDICAYCYTEHIFDWLKTTKNSELVNGFLSAFHFDLERKGYVKRAEEEGFVLA